MGKDEPPLLDEQAWAEGHHHVNHCTGNWWKIEIFSYDLESFWRLINLESYLESVTNLMPFKILPFIYFIYIHTYSMYEQ